MSPNKENAMAVINNERIIEKDNLIRLSKKGAQVFFDVLENPPEPNAKLINAVKNYRAHIK